MQEKALPAPSVKQSGGLTPQPGQRREVTVLLLNIANYPQLLRLLPADDVYRIIDDLSQTMVDVIHNYEGVVDKLTSDGLMAIFGIPINHENDPERAIRAAFELLDVAKQLPAVLQIKPLEIDLRMGVHTGQVLSGGMRAGRIDYTVIGSTINLASRLVSQAKTGMILASFQTYQRSRPVCSFSEVVLNQGDLPDELARVYRAEEIKVQPGQLRGLPGLQVPMVGRQEWLEKLKQALDKVCEQKKSRITLISGEAGLGKSRLVAEFRKLLPDLGVRVVQGSCSSYMRITPYYVVSQVIRDIFRIAEKDAPEVQTNVLKQHLVQCGLDIPDVLPYIVYILGLAQEDRAQESRLMMLAPSMLQRQIHSALRALILAEAEISPVVLIFDDLHWVDPASTEFLKYLCQSIDETRLLMILVARDFSNNEQLKSLHEVAFKLVSAPVEFDLTPLSSEETRQLVDQLVNDDTQQANLAKSAIVMRSGGNPYYAEELVRILMDQGGMAAKAQKWSVTGQAEEILARVPGTLQDIILARLDRLPEALRQLAQKVSVLGSSFGVRAVQILASAPVEQLNQQLDELVRRDFLASALLEGEPGFVFKHPLAREVVYHTLLKSDLRRYHLHIAQAVAAGHSWLPGEQDEVLAYHFVESASPSKAIPYLMAAAEKALRRFANEVAVQSFRKLLVLLDEFPDTAPGLFGRAQIGLGKALKFTNELKEALYALAAGMSALLPNQVLPEQPADLNALIDGYVELADIRVREGTLDTAQKLLQSGLALLGDDAAERYPVAWSRLAERVAWVEFRQGKLEEASQQAERVLAQAGILEAQDPMTLASLYNTLGGVFWMRSRYSEAVDYVERSLRSYQSIGYYFGIAIANTNTGILHFSLGHWAEAVRNLEHADEILREHGYTLERPINLRNLGEILIYMGEISHAREVLNTSFEISTRLGMNLALAYTEIAFCRLALADGQLAEAAAYLESARKRLAPLPGEHNDRSVQMQTLQAVILGEQGDIAGGLELANKAYQAALEAGYQSEQTEILRIMGMLNTRRGLFDRAEQQLIESVKSADTQKDHHRLAQASYELGELFRQRAGAEPGRRGELLASSREAYDRAYGLFQALGARKELERTRAGQHCLDMQ